MDQIGGDMIKAFQKIKKDMFKYLEVSLKIYFCKCYDVFSEHQAIVETHKIVHKYLKDKYPKYPEALFPKFRIKRMEYKNMMQIQIQEYLSDINGWNYGGTIMMPDSVIHDIYYKTELTGFEPFILMTKYNHDSKSIYVGGHTAIEEYAAEIMSPLSMAYQYAIDEEIL